MSDINRRDAFEVSAKLAPAAAADGFVGPKGRVSGFHAAIANPDRLTEVLRKNLAQ
jgi:hypothetical protein